MPAWANPFSESKRSSRYRTLTPGIAPPSYRGDTQGRVMSPLLLADSLAAQSRGTCSWLAAGAGSGPGLPGGSREDSPCLGKFGLQIGFY